MYLTTDLASSTPNFKEYSIDLFLINPVTKAAEKASPAPVLSATFVFLGVTL